MQVKNLHALIIGVGLVKLAIIEGGKGFLCEA